AADQVLGAPQLLVRLAAHGAVERARDGAVCAAGDDRVQVKADPVVEPLTQLEIGTGPLELGPAAVDFTALPDELVDLVAERLDERALGLVDGDLDTVGKWSLEGHSGCPFCNGGGRLLL